MIRQIVQLDERFYVTRDDDERFEFGVRSLHITRRERKVIAFILFVCLAVAIVKVSLIPLTFLIGAIVLIYWGLRKNADKYDCFTIDFRKGELRAGRERKPDYRDNDSIVVALENLSQLAIVADEPRKGPTYSGVYAETAQGDPVRLSDMMGTELQRVAALMLAWRLGIPVEVRDEAGVSRLDQALGKRLKDAGQVQGEPVREAYRRCLAIANSEHTDEFNASEIYSPMASAVPTHDVAHREGSTYPSTAGTASSPGEQLQKLVDRHWWQPDHNTIRHRGARSLTSCEEKDGIMVLGRNFQALQMAGLSFFALSALPVSMAAHFQWRDLLTTLIPVAVPGYLVLRVMFDLIAPTRSATVLERATRSIWSIQKKRDRLDLATKIGDFSNCCLVLRYQKHLQRGPNQHFWGLPGIFLLGWDGSVAKIPADAGTSAVTGKAISDFLNVPFEDVKSSVMMSQYVAKRAVDLAETMNAHVISETVEET